MCLQHPSVLNSKERLWEESRVTSQIRVNFRKIRPRSSFSANSKCFFEVCSWLVLFFWRKTFFFSKKAACSLHCCPFFTRNIRFPDPFWYCSYQNPIQSYPIPTKSRRAGFESGRTASWLDPPPQPPSLFHPNSASLWALFVYLAFSVCGPQGSLQVQERSVRALCAHRQSPVVLLSAKRRDRSQPSPMA